jgi:hypothetical protein
MRISRKGNTIRPVWKKQGARLLPNPLFTWRAPQDSNPRTPWFVASYSGGMNAIIYQLLMTLQMYNTFNIYQLLSL